VNSVTGIILFIVVVIIGTWVSGYFLHSNSDIQYSGDILFDNEDDYLAFKQYLDSDDVKIVDIQSLNSPNHLVKYQVNVDQDFDFKYGGDKKILDGDIYGFAAIITFVLVVLLTVSLLFGVKRNSNKSSFK